MKDIYLIGDKIKEVAKSKNISIDQLAEKCSCVRSAMYFRLRSPSISAEVLMEISIALEHDFFQYYSQRFNEAIKQNKNK